MGYFLNFGQLETRERLALCRGVARNLLRGTNQRVWETEVTSGVQGQNLETIQNTNGAVAIIDLR